MNFTGMHQWSFEVNDTQMPHRAQLLFGRKRHHVDLHTEFRKDASVSSSIVCLVVKLACSVLFLSCPVSCLSNV